LKADFRVRSPLSGRNVSHFMAISALVVVFRLLSSFSFSSLPRSLKIISNQTDSIAEVCALGCRFRKATKKFPPARDDDGSRDSNMPAIAPFHHHQRPDSIETASAHENTDQTHQPQRRFN
jgi:hypothetical protein